MERLTAQEESVMLYIWKLGSCFIRDILNEMPDPKLHQRGIGGPEP